MKEKSWFQNWHEHGVSLKISIHTGDDFFEILYNFSLTDKQEDLPVIHYQTCFEAIRKVLECEGFDYGNLSAAGLLHMKRNKVFKEKKVKFYDVLKTLVKQAG